MSTSAKFPADFHWGYATASAQVEGSISADGKSHSIWDTFSSNPSHSEDGGNTSTATETYTKWQEDIALMKSYGVNSYRLSLSWTRILPDGVAGSKVNKAGVEWYRKVLKGLLGAGITPFVTLFHWDLPQVLQDKYLGFLSSDVVPDFENYARVCYREFGDLVKYWFTINEPNVYSLLGHAIGKHAPGRSSDRTISSQGDSRTEPLIVGHNLLLAHASAVKAYHRDFASSQGGKIGLVVNMLWGEPLTDSAEDKAATEKFLAVYNGWFAEPLVTGDYPALCKEVHGSRLPVFTNDQKALVKGSSDFLAINHYTTNMVRAAAPSATPATGPLSDFLPGIEIGFEDRDGNAIGPAAGLSWVRPVPWGFGKLLDWAYKSYGLDIYISENGVVCPNENKLSRDEALKDDFRINYLSTYADQIALKIEQGVPVKSYLMWAFTDNFEWQEGYTARFGVTWIDYQDDCRRYPKKSAGYMRDYFAARKDC